MVHYSIDRYIVLTESEVGKSFSVDWEQEKFPINVIVTGDSQKREVHLQVEVFLL